MQIFFANIHNAPDTMTCAYKKENEFQFFHAYNRHSLTQLRLLNYIMSRK